MGGERLFRWAVVANLAAILGLAGWARVTSLGTAPGPMADEAFFGVQAERLIGGKHVSSRTGSGKLVDPIYTMVEAPLHLVSKPTYTLERVPAVIFGCVAVAMAYALSARMTDRRTAAIAAGLLGVLPIAIIFSRVGWEYSEVPLLTLLIVFCAWKANRAGLLVAFAVGVHVSPTILFLAPVPLAILAVRWVEGDPGGDRRRSILVTAGLLVGVIAAFGILKRNNPATQWTYATYNFGPCDWGRFFRLYKHNLMGFCQGGPVETGRLHDGLFWIPYVAVLGLGTWRLVARKRWDRLALVAGTAASTAGYHLVVGPEGFHPALARYGLFLAAPTVLSFACLAESLLVRPEGGWRAAARRLQVGALIGVAYSLLFSYVTNYFQVHVDRSGGRESFWTMGTESEDIMHRMASVLARDGGRATLPPGEGARRVVAEDWWSYKPLEYFLARDDGLEVLSLEKIDATRKAEVVRDQVERGAYAVGIVGQEVDETIKRSFPGESLRHWHVQAGESPCYVMYRLKRHPGEHDGRCFCNGTLGGGRDGRTVR